MFGASEEEKLMDDDEEKKEEQGNMSRLAELQTLLGRYEKALLARGVDATELEGIRTGAATNPLLEVTRKMRAPPKEQIKDWDGATQNIVAFQKLIGRPLLPVEVRLEHVNLTTTVDSSGPKIKTVANSNPLGLAMTSLRKKQLQKKTILNDVSGVFKPGELTLVLGPPGSGKTSFLKAIAGRLKKQSGVKFEGRVTYNGEEVGSGTFLPTKVASYVNQTDSHEPVLTVEQTLKFAYRTIGAQDRLAPVERERARKESGLSKEELEEMLKVHDRDDVKVKLVMQTLGIAHVKDTIVGDASTRGVSGGQRRRVTLAEMIMSRMRILCGDEVSTGLDSQTAFEIVSIMKTAFKAFQTVGVMSLLQPPPEVFDLFDKVVFLFKGSVIYHGPTTGIIAHFNSMHFEIPPRKDPADFLIEVVSPIGKAYYTGGDNEAWTARRFMDAYRDGNAHPRMLEEISRPSLLTAEWPEYYSREFTEPLSYYTTICLQRRYDVFKKNPGPVKSRAIQSVVVGLFTGLLTLDTPYNDFGTKVGLIFSSMIFIALGGMGMMQTQIKERAVFYKQRDAAFFPTLAYVLSDLAFEVPITLVLTMVYSNIVFWMSGLASGNWVNYTITCIIVAMAMNNWFGFIAGVAPNATAAGPMGGMSVLMIILFSGFVVQRQNMPEAWKPVHWLSPVALGFRAILVGEFRSDRYKKCSYQKKFYCEGEEECCREKDDGLVFLKIYNIQTEEKWIYIGQLSLLAMFFFSLFLRTAALSMVRHDSGSKADEADEEYATDREIIAGPRDERVLRDGEQLIPFEPMVLAFEDVSYCVPIVTGKGRSDVTELELLKKVTGFTKPREMTALMGSSGAGKTTLLDVLAGRKSGGTIKGTITVNGHEKKQSTFLRVSGYVEQLDVHSPGATVAEAVSFSAALRLPGKTPEKDRQQFARTILRLLELEEISGKLVGELATGGLTFEQRKRLTMAVELAANPAILFLDEPTSGLDSRAALVVIRGVRAVAESGRSVICTVHQPSFALFTVFDRLLLLKRGGKTVYFGDLGQEAATLTGYLEHCARRLGDADLGSLPQGGNPATWMLTACVAEEIDYAVGYTYSKLATENAAEARRLAVPTDLGPLFFAEPFAVNYRTQFRVLIKKMVLSYWRGPSYNVSRGMVSVVVAIIFGTVYSQKRPNAVDNFSGANGRVGLFFLDTFFMGVIFFSSALPAMSAERASFYREHASRMYSVGPYVACFFWAEAPYLLLYSFMHVGVLWAFVDFYPGFLFYWAYYFLYVTCMTFYAQFLVAAFPDAESAQSIGQALLSASTLVAGYSITPDNIPDYFRFLYWLTPIHYSLEGHIVTQFHGANQQLEDIPDQPTVEWFFTSHDSDSHFGGYFIYSHRFQNIAILVGITIVFRILTVYYLTFKDYSSK